MNILITGGTGYIGSHTIVELCKFDHNIDIIDNLFNSKENTLDKIEKITGKRPNFYKIDLLEKFKLASLFETHQYDLVIHFAGFKAVSESIKNPLLYYNNNVVGTINLLECMKNYGVKKIIFSSSATVYGKQPTPKLTEDMQTGVGITNPYGKTKYVIEEILKDVSESDPEFSAVILRYFNPIGNHPSGLLGEGPNNIPSNLMPIIVKVSRGEIPELKVYGDDYPTPDGTGIRDYIHVVDLANGHVAAMNFMNPGVKIYNLGTGRGTSVLEMITAFEKSSGKTIPYKIVEQRPGDLAEVYADPSKAYNELNWKTTLSIDDAMDDTVKYLHKTA